MCPGRTFVQAGFFYGLLSSGPGDLVRRPCFRMVDVQSQQSETARDADHPRDSLIAAFGIGKPLKLDAGVELSPFQIAYTTYGSLNADRSNAVMVCHALTGDQYVAQVHPVTKKTGWWETLIGPGKPLDPAR